MKPTDDKKFKQGFVRLSADDIHDLAKTMEELGERESIAADDELALIHEEMKLNQELFDRYAPAAKPEGLNPDPSCLSEDELWQRLNTDHRKVSPIKSRTRRPHRGWLAFAVAAAALLLLVNPWVKLTDDPLRWNKGPDSSDTVFSREGCQLAFKGDRGTIELDSAGVQLLASMPVLLMARCQSDGFLQILLSDGSNTLSFTNVQVTSSNQWQDLTDGNSKSLGLQLPAQGSLNLIYGMSDHTLAPAEIEALRSPDAIDLPNKTWRWVQQRQWVIDQRLSP